jgi:hypothetical protein
MTFSYGDRISATFKVPILGWSSSTIMSSDADTRVVAARAFRGTPAQSIPNSSITKVQLNSISIDKTGSFDNVTNYRYTFRSPGIYRVSANVRYAPNATGVRVVYIYKNGSTYASKDTFNGTASYSVGTDVSTLIEVVAGDYVECFTYQDSGGALDLSAGSNLTFFDVEKISGPVQIAASEKVSVFVSGTAGDVIGTSLSLIKLINKTKDSHASYSTATGLFTAPISGVYSVAWASTVTVNLSVSERYRTSLMKNGSQFINGIGSIGVGVLREHYSTGSALSIPLLQGDTLSLGAVSSVATTATTADSNWYLTIERTGNY